MNTMSTTLSPTKTNGSYWAKKEFETSCDPWCQFWLLLRLPALNFQGITHIRTWPSKPCHWTWYKAWLPRTLFQHFMPGKTYCSSCTISPLYCVQSACHQSLAYSSLPRPPTKQLGPGDSSFPWSLGKKNQVVQETETQSLHKTQSIKLTASVAILLNTTR